MRRYLKSVAGSAHCIPDSSPKRPVRIVSCHAAARSCISLAIRHGILPTGDADGYLVAVLDQVIFLDRFDEGPP